MKMNKLLAFGASLVLISSCAILPANAETNSASTFVVVGIDNENSDSYILRIPQGTPNKIIGKSAVDFKISKETINSFNPAIGEVQLGDIITFENLNWNDMAEFYGMHYFSEFLEDRAVDEDTVVSVDESLITASIVGSVFDNPEITACTIEGINTISPGGAAYAGEYSKDNPVSYYLMDEDGYRFDFLVAWGITPEDGYTYYQSDCVDGASLQVGDTVSCITYKGTPMIITEKVSDITVNPVPAVTASGDADGSGTLDILDVITINKAVLGKEEISQDRISFVDFNGNGIPDSDDALTMLKMIVGLN